VNGWFRVSDFRADAYNCGLIITEGTTPMRYLCVAGVIVLSGCAAIPVQETTLRNSNGGTVTCKQTGRGVISYSVGKSIYQDCIDNAHANGYQ
jgi:hypothetical protein